MSQAAIGPDFYQPFNVLRDFAAKIALDLERFNLVVPGGNSMVDNLPDRSDFLLRQIGHALVEIDPRGFQYLLRPRSSNAVNIGQAYFNSLISWQVNASYTRHS